MSDDERTTLALERPIKHGSESISELCFRPLKAKDLRRVKIVDGYTVDTILTLAGKLAGVPTQVIDELSGEDLANVMTLVSSFMPGSPPTGEPASEP